MISQRYFPSDWRTLAILATLSVAPTLAIGAEHPEIRPEAGWTPLFNGKDLSGWVSVTQDGIPADPDAWVVENGAITRKGKAYLRSESEYRDLILDLEFKVGALFGNSPLARA